MLVDRVALPLLAQGEEKLTVNGEEEGVTVTDTLVVPYAESGLAPTPNVGLEIVTVVEFRENPKEELTAVVPTWALAVIAVAPPAVVFAADNDTDATPEELVKAVPLAGTNVASVVSTLNVTTVLATGLPDSSRTVALASAGVLVVVAPVVGSVNAIEIVEDGVVVPGVVVVPEVVVPEVVTPLPPQLTNRAVIAASIKAVKVLV
jgi:hypothetical protein